MIVQTQQKDTVKASEYSFVSFTIIMLQQA